MSLAYRLLYAVGYAPWEQIAGLPAANQRISALFEREEQGREAPYGRALDLGCGSGIWAVVTKLGSADVGSGFRFLLDFFLFHDELTDDQRTAMGRQVTAIAAPGATLLMTAWAPGRRGPLPRGASRGDIEAACPEWTVIDEEPFDVVTGARFYKHIRNADPRVYRLRRA
jgi:hypothetical protein